MAAVWIVTLFLFGLIGMELAKRKDRNPVKGFALAALLGPIGLLILLAVGPDEKRNRKCPSCLAMVPNAARACAHCGRAIPVAT